MIFLDGLRLKERPKAGPRPSKRKTVVINFPEREAVGIKGGLRVGRNSISFCYGLAKSQPFELARGATILGVTWGYTPLVFCFR